MDLADQSRELSVNFWNWHPTVELGRSAGIVDTERIALMHEQWAGAIVSEDEARVIARAVQQGALSRLRPDERVLLNLSITSEPDDGMLHRGDDSYGNYSATHEWLTRFVHFCSECSGFRVM